MTLDLLRQDTICAPATAVGAAAIAVIRVSGPRADAVRAALFTPRRLPQRPAVATLGDAHVSATFDDEALCIWFPAGRSYTGEPSFELQLHGNPHIVERALARLRELGCRMAEPGELTLRAVLTGRLDLSAAEAVDDLIVARSEAGLRAAARNLRGGLRAAVEPVRARLIDALAEIEARLDFPDEDLGDIPAHAVAGLVAADATLAHLLLSSHAGERLVRGARVVLYGPPNAGKSSLFNALLREERALVHDEPGTTRDVVEAPCTFGPFAATLVDVAGVRDTALASHVEKLGIARAETERERGDLVLAVMPAHWPHAAAALTALGGDIAVFTHSDRVDAVQAGPAAPDGPVLLSTRTGSGVDVLRRSIEDRLRGATAFDEEALVMRARQTEQLRAAQARVRLATDAAAAHAPYEVVASEVRGAALALDRLLGRDLLEGTNAEVLDAIFSRFCIGK